MIINAQFVRIVKTKSIPKLKLDGYAKNLQAIFININWQTSVNPKGVTMKDFQKLSISKNVMKNGILFIWAEKFLMNEILETLEKLDFYYIENFTILQLS